MMWTITNRNVLAEIASIEDGLNEASITGRDHIRCWWRNTHIERVKNSIRKLMRQGFVWMDEKGKYLATNEGRNWLNGKNANKQAA